MERAHKTTACVREAVGVLVDEEQLAAVVFDLETHGFERRHLSVPAAHEFEKTRDEEQYRATEDVEEDPHTPRSFFVPKEMIGLAQGLLISIPCLVLSLAVAEAMIASGKSTWMVVLSAVIGGVSGIFIGLLMARGLSRRHTATVRTQLRQGGLILWVTLENKGYEARALEILRKHGARDVHVHEIPNCVTMSSNRCAFH